MYGAWKRRKQNGYVLWQNNRASSQVRTRSREFNTVDSVYAMRTTWCENWQNGIHTRAGKFIFIRFISLIKLCARYTSTSIFLRLVIHRSTSLLFFSFVGTWGSLLPMLINAFMNSLTGANFGDLKDKTRTSLAKKDQSKCFTLHVHSRRRKPLILSKQIQLLSKARPELRSPRHSLGRRRCCWCGCCLLLSPLMIGNERSRKTKRLQFTNCSRTRWISC